MGGKRPTQPTGTGTHNGTGSVKSDEGDDKPMSREQMEELADGLGRLDEKALSGIVFVLQQALLPRFGCVCEQVRCLFMQM